MAEKRVCVTGAGGYVASWLVKLLLSKGFIVHGTLRDHELSDDKLNSHLKKLEKASENLKLFKADLLDFESLCAAIDACTAVFHVACPCPVPGTTLPNPEVEMLEPAVRGTRNVLKACEKGKVKKVVMVSSVAAVKSNANWPNDRPKDEDCWSDPELCRTNQNFYSLAKTLAETEALEYAKKSDINIVTICPSMVIGPMLQSTLNASSFLLLKYLKDGNESIEDKDRSLIDARDLAEAIFLIYDKPEAKGRYICSSYTILVPELAEKLKSIYLNYNYPKSYTEVKEGLKFSSKKLESLGWKYRPLEETLVDAIKNFEEKGLLDKPNPSQL